MMSFFCLSSHIVISWLKIRISFYRKGALDRFYSSTRALSHAASTRWFIFKNSVPCRNKALEHKRTKQTPETEEPASVLSGPHLQVRIPWGRRLLVHLGGAFCSCLLKREKNRARNSKHFRTVT